MRSTVQIVRPSHPGYLGWIVQIIQIICPESLHHEVGMICWMVWPTSETSVVDGRIAAKGKHHSGKLLYHTTYEKVNRQIFTRAE